MKPLDEMIAVMEASKTEEIESRTVAGASLNYPEWTVCEKPGWNWVGFDYRVKAQTPRHIRIFPGITLCEPEGEFIELTKAIRERLGL